MHKWQDYNSNEGPILIEKEINLLSRKYLINTARGEIIDENALTRMLRSKELAGAALDVFERGNEINPRLKELDNVFLLPHMSSATLESRIEMGEKVIINIQTFSDGHTPPDIIFNS